MHTQDLYDTVITFIDKTFEKEDFANDPDWMKKEQELIEEAHNIDALAGPGLNIGRLLAFPYEDGYAYYMIYEISERHVKAGHLALGDGWAQDDIVDPDTDELSLRVAKKYIERADALKSIFG